jgi:hypothetical protein
LLHSQLEKKFHCDGRIFNIIVGPENTAKMLMKILIGDDVLENK